MIAPRIKMLTQAPDVKALRIWPPAFAPAWARKMSRPSSATTWQVVKGSAVAMGPMRPMRPKTRPMMSVPAAEPIEKYSPDGVKIGNSPIAMPIAMPRPRATGFRSVRPCEESPKNLVISAIFEVGATTRTRSPSWRTRPGSATMSTSPRRTREIVAENSLARPSDATVRPATFGLEIVIRRKSR